jgi:hypothetical protein
MIRMKMTNTKRWLISAFTACLFTVLCHPMEYAPVMQDVSASYNRDKNEWIVTGSFLFTKLQVYVFPVQLTGFRRVGMFSLRIPDAGNGSLSGPQYHDKGLAQARQNAGPWVPDIVALIAATLISTITIRFLWWCFEIRKRKSNQPSQPIAGMPGSG